MYTCTKQLSKYCLLMSNPSSQTAVVNPSSQPEQSTRVVNPSSQPTYIICLVFCFFLLKHKHYSCKDKNIMYNCTKQLSKYFLLKSNPSSQPQQSTRVVNWSSQLEQSTGVVNRLLFCFCFVLFLFFAKRKIMYNCTKQLSKYFLLI